MFIFKDQLILKGKKDFFPDYRNQILKTIWKKLAVHIMLISDIRCILKIQKWKQKPNLQAIFKNTIKKKN